MNNYQSDVQQFHETMGLTVGAYPAFRDMDLRIDLVTEEYNEFIEACGYSPKQLANAWAHEADRKEPQSMADAIKEGCDLIYVILGTFVSWGVDLDAFWAEVHRSNMSKVGGPVREDGKRLKGPNYTPADLKPILAAQREQRQAVMA